MKAASTRAAAPLFASLCHEHLAGQSAEETAARAVADVLVECYDVLDDAPMLVPAADLVRLRTVCLDFGVNDPRLREYSR